VTINGVVRLGNKVAPHDEVRIDGKLIREKKQKKSVYLAFTKVGIECTTNLDVHNIVD
jgi:23S rRNA pseudouridine2604 synthase